MYVRANACRRNCSTSATAGGLIALWHATNDQDRPQPERKDLRDQRRRAGRRAPWARDPVACVRRRLYRAGSEVFR